MVNLIFPMFYFKISASEEKLLKVPINFNELGSVIFCSFIINKASKITFFNDLSSMV